MAAVVWVLLPMSKGYLQWVLSLCQSYLATAAVLPAGPWLGQMPAENFETGSGLLWLGQGSWPRLGLGVDYLELDWAAWLGNG
jgi:hypothetical protein